MFQLDHPCLLFVDVGCGGFEPTDIPMDMSMGVPMDVPMAVPIGVPLPLPDPDTGGGLIETMIGILTSL